MDFSDQKSYLRAAEVPSPGRLYRTIPEMIRHHSMDANKVAHIYIDWETFEEETLSYKEIYERGKEFAEGLTELGIKKGDIIAVGTENIPTWVWVTVGVQMCGAIPLHFVFNLKDGSDVESVLKAVKNKCTAIIFPPGNKDSNIQTMENIFCPGPQKGTVSSSSLPAVKWSILLSSHHEVPYHFDIADILEKSKPGIALPNLDPDDIMAIFLTSGSTGTPKLVPFCHKTMLVAGYHCMKILGEENDMYFNDRFFSWVAGYVKSTCITMLECTGISAFVSNTC